MKFLTEQGLWMLSHQQPPWTEKLKKQKNSAIDFSSGYFRPMTAGISSSLQATLNWISRKNGLIDV